MARLTKYSRSKIVEAAIEQRFAADREALADKYAAFALDVYNVTYPPAVRKRMAELPKGWLPEQSHLRASIAGGFNVLYFCGSQARKAATVFGRPDVELRVLAGRPTALIDAGTPLADRWAKLHNEEADLCTAITAATLATEQLISRISTTEKLAEIWPEGVQFLPPEQVPLNLPALPVGDVNKMLGLI